MEEKERYEFDSYGDYEFIHDRESEAPLYDNLYSVEKILNQQDKRIKELEMEIQELKDKIEFLTTFKEVISEYKPAFCKLAGRDCEWLGKEKQLAISESDKRIIRRRKNHD